MLKVGKLESNPHTMVIFFGFHGSIVSAPTAGHKHSSFEEVCNEH